jgi:hypothetical protein
VSRLVFLLEEYSMKVFLDGLLPRLFPALPFLCVPHEGKQDLEMSIPRKLRAWREPGVRFVVLRDNDGRDCRAVRRRIEELCALGSRDDVLVRLACQELEAWYFGDVEALADAYERDQLPGIRDRARFRDPDAIDQPARALSGLIGEFQKVSGARRMGQRLSRTNTSRSYQVMLEGVSRLAGSLPGG